jgi:hypothetical protein
VHTVTASSIKAEIIKSNKDVCNPTSDEDIDNIGKMFELISELSEDQKTRLYTAMRQIADASLVIDELYKELRSVYYDVSCVDRYKDFDGYERLKDRCNFFGNHVKVHLDVLIFMYQRAVSYIPSLSKLWFRLDDWDDDWDK